MEAIKIMCVVLGMLGMVPLLIVLIKYRMQKAFMKKAFTTTAEVLSCEKRFGAKGSVYYILSLQYQTNDGKQVLNGTVGSRKQKNGDRIPLMYLPGNPTKFSIDFGKRMPMAIVLTLVFFGLIIWLCTWLINMNYTAT